MFKQALAAVALSGVAIAASATSYSIGTLPTATSVYSNVANVAGPSFTDTYSFLAPSGGSVASASGVTLDLSSMLNINSLTISLFDSSNALVQTGTVGESSTLVDVPLLSGAAYHFEVTGQVAGSAGGIYTFIASAAPVPEPETWALMLGGLAAIGFMVMRRKAN
jgi:hypothetical protein